MNFNVLEKLIAARDSLAEHDQAIECGMWNYGDPPALAGVYAFYLNSEAIYIGQSMNMRKRMSGHVVRCENPNCEVFWVECNQPLEAERWFIKYLRPKLNVQTRDKSNKRKKPRTATVLVSEATHAMLLNYCEMNGVFIQAVADSAIKIFLANTKQGAPKQ